MKKGTVYPMIVIDHFAGVPDTLRAAVVPMIPESVCRLIYKFSMSDRMFCAGYLQGNIDTCQGDSGGPFVCSLHGMSFTAYCKVQ